MTVPVVLVTGEHSTDQAREYVRAVVELLLDFINLYFESDVPAHWNLSILFYYLT